MFSRRHFHFVLAAGLLLTSGRTWGADEVADKLPWDADPRLPATVTQALQDRDYDRALQAIDDVRKADDDKYVAARLDYVRGRAQHLAGRYDEAVAIFIKIEQADPNSTWGRRARFARGVSLAK